MNISKALLIPLLMFISNVNLFASHDIEVTGNITELGAEYLVVEGYTFFIDENTELRGPNGDPVSFSFFQLNDFVEVRGDSNGDGTYLATRVKSEDGPSNENEIELTGYVTDVGSNSLVIDGNTFFVDENTEYKGRHGNPFSFEQIEDGMLLEVKAALQANGDLLATRIKNEDDQHHGEEVEITAIIDSLTANSIILGQWEFFVDAQTVILGDHNMPITFTDLNVGNKVEVKAFRQLDNTYLASRIKLEEQHENEIELTAQIDSIVGSDITVGGITFTTDSNTIFLDHNRMPITLADLSEGMWVEVKGFKNLDGSHYASKVKIEDFVRNEIAVKGNITELTDSYLIVNGINFSVDGTTKVFDHSNNPIQYSDLQVGQLVEVKGVKTGLSTAKAHRIKLEDNEDIELFGRITAINADNIELNGLTVFVNQNTVYLNHAKEPITFGDLSVDQFVELKMVKNPDGSLLAIRIKIEDGMNFSKVIGFAELVNGSVIQLPTGSYTINNETVVIDINYNVINANQLTNGQHVIVWAVLDASSNKTSLQIQSKVSSPTGVEETPIVANNFNLEQNYPNPVNPATTIRYSIPKEGLVSLKVYNLIGEEIVTLVNEIKQIGSYDIIFNSTNLSSGTYFYRLLAGSFVETKKMVLMK
jgi:hypothetical protein